MQHIPPAPLAPEPAAGMTPADAEADAASTVPSPAMQLVVGIAVVLVAGAMAFGALSIPSNAGYGGVGPNFLPYLVALVLAVCGGFLIWESRTGGYRAADEPSGAVHANKVAFAFVSAGLLLNGALITSVGFIVSCTLCYVLAAQGLRRAAGQNAGTLRQWLIDMLTGALISAPVYWAFTKFLAINLPGLTQTGWL